jgi:hypothetical protein
VVGDEGAPVFVAGALDRIANGFAGERHPAGRLNAPAEA